MPCFHKQALNYKPCPIFIASVSFIIYGHVSQAKNFSNKFPKKKLVFVHPLASGSLAVAAGFFTLSIIVCPISF